jgi:hypothetical protein
VVQTARTAVERARDPAIHGPSGTTKRPIKERGRRGESSERPANSGLSRG